MKKISILIIMLFSISLIGQEQLETKPKRQLGFDANSINLLIPIEHSIGIPAPFFLHYMKFKDETKYNVYGLNININGLLEDIESSNRNRNAFDIQLNLKFGRGQVFDHWRNFYFHGGLNHRLTLAYDYIVNNESSEGANDGDSRSDKIVSYSIGPFAGLEYKINSKLSLYTQLSYQIGIVGSNTRFKDDRFESNNYTNNSLRLRDFFSLPTWVVLYYSF
jgi:hypothetical protein